MAFGGTRTWHRMTSAIEDAGFEIRDSIAWLYASGFPKSLDVSKAVDKTVGEDDAKKWSGWGTALKPAHEPIVVARKPLVGTVAKNVLAHGTGALNIGGCRVVAQGRPLRVGDYKDTDNTVYEGRMDNSLRGGSKAVGVTNEGRWPPNVTLDDHAAGELDEQTGVLSSGSVAPEGYVGKYNADVYGKYAHNQIRPETVYADSGGASRFFPVFKYQAKAPKKERPRVDGVSHPTVKPLALMQWLVRLVTPPEGVVLDPFAGSGTTVEAVVLEGFRCVGIESNACYLPLIDDRMKKLQTESSE